ncbi:MAG: hypothetical protein JWM38_1914 [Sphingomonas bacterium]|jgi:hypothetical protein|nr:hypothetical protein [Sphingomonas bacterium]
MSIAAIDRLTVAQLALIHALDQGDVAAIESATTALDQAVQQARTVAGWQTTPELESGVRQSLQASEAARVRVGYLADRSRRLLQALLGLSGRLPLGYGRNGRYRAAG